MDGSIVGTAAYGSRPFILRPTTAPTVGITQNPPPDASGVSTQAVTLTLVSPYNTANASMTYNAKAIRL